MNIYTTHIRSIQPKSDHYLQRYIKFINHILENPNDPDQYLEGHHILPKSMFREFEKEKWNLIPLTARQHFIAHHLLWKTYKNREMVYVFMLMNHCNGIKKINSRVYENLKKEVSEIRSYSTSELWTQERKSKFSIRMSGENNPMYGRIRTGDTKKLWENPEYREKILKAMKSESYIEKQSKASKQRWECENYKNNMIEKIKEKHKDPIYKQKVSKSVKEAWKCPN
jgi:hypothetical protein